MRRIILDALKAGATYEGALVSLAPKECQEILRAIYAQKPANKPFRPGKWLDKGERAELLGPFQPSKALRAK